MGGRECRREEISLSAGGREYGRERLGHAWANVVLLSLTTGGELQRTLQCTNATALYVPRPLGVRPGVVDHRRAAVVCGHGRPAEVRLERELRAVVVVSIVIEDHQVACEGWGGGGVAVKMA